MLSQFPRNWFLHYKRPKCDANYSINVCLQQQILYFYLSKHWYKVRLRSQKGLFAFQLSDCNVMFKEMKRSSSLYSKNAVEKILIQKLIWHLGHTSLAVLTQNIIHTLLLVKIVKTFHCRVTISTTYSL